MFYDLHVTVIWVSLAFRVLRRIRRRKRTMLLTGLVGEAGEAVVVPGRHFTLMSPTLPAPPSAQNCLEKFIVFILRLLILPFKMAIPG